LRLDVLNHKTLRPLLKRAEALLRAAKLDVTQASLYTAMLYLVVQEARAAQANAPSAQTTLEDERAAQSSAEPTQDITASSAQEELDEFEEAGTLGVSPIDPQQAREELRALIQEELTKSATARGISPEQVLALEEGPGSSSMQPDAGLRSGGTTAEPQTAGASGTSPWPFDIALGSVSLSPMGLLGGMLTLAGMAGGGGSSVATKAVLYAMGIVADGYISGATVKLYGMVNGQEVVIATTTTNSNGQYQFEQSLLANATKIVAAGGTDISTGLAFNVELKAPATATVVNPLTTLVQAYVEQNSGLNVTVEQAMQAVKTALGIAGTVDLLNVDPIAKAASSTGAALTEALALQSKAAQIANVLVTGSLAVASAGGVDLALHHADDGAVASQHRAAGVAL
jgi:hypothetical protein